MPHMSNLPWLAMFTACFMTLLVFIAIYNFKASLQIDTKKCPNQKDKVKNLWQW